MASEAATGTRGTHKRASNGTRSQPNNAAVASDLRPGKTRHSTLQCTPTSLGLSPETPTLRHTTDNTTQICSSTSAEKARLIMVD